MEAPVVAGIEHELLAAKVTVRSVPNRPGVAAALFGALAAAGINVDIIVQTAAKDGVTDISFTVPEGSLAPATEVASRIGAGVGGGGVLHDDDLAKVSVFGAGLRSSPHVTATVFGVLADAGINIHMISTSTARISCVVSASDVDRAVKCLFAAFEVDPSDPGAVSRAP